MDEMRPPSIRCTIIPLVILITLSGCGESIPTETPLPSPLPEDLYFGQDPPGLVPEKFAPGIVSTPDENEYSGSFSPDGTEYYFYRFSNTSPARIMFSKLVDGAWTIPEPLAVTAEHMAFEPYVTPDNRRLYFAWDVPVEPGEPPYSYYFVERTQEGWSDPVFAGQGMFVSSSLDGQLYTTDMSTRHIDGRTYLARVTVTDGVFAAYERLPIEVAVGEPAHPCIALDGSFIIFDVDSGKQLAISFRQNDGTWGKPVDLTAHGFDRKAGGAYISPDGKYLFFSLNRDIWWVDIQVIEDLRPPEE